MKKVTSAKTDVRQIDPDLLKEYDFSKGVRGKYVQRLAAGSNIVVLAPDVAELFPDSESVNEALRALVTIAKRQTKSVQPHLRYQLLEFQLSPKTVYKTKSANRP